MTQAMTSTARIKTQPGTMFPVNNGSTNNANNHFEWADLTAAPTLAAGGDGDFGAGMGYFQMIVHIKAFTAGTNESQIWIEVADNAAMSTNLRKLDPRRLPTTVASIAVPWTYQFGCPTPDGARQFARPNLYNGGGAGAITMDAFLDASL